MMETILFGAAVIVGAFFLLPHLSSGKTKLFRRVWSSQRLGGREGPEYQAVAVDSLTKLYAVHFSDDAETLREKIGKLLSDATEFDLRNPHNGGIQVMPILAKQLLLLKGSDRHPELETELLHMTTVDSLAFHAALQKTLKEIR